MENQIKKAKKLQITNKLFLAKKLLKESENIFFETDFDSKFFAIEIDKILAKISQGISEIANN